MIAAVIVLGLHSSYGSIGETEEQCNLRYGTGTSTYWDQQTKTKSIRYEHTLTADVDVEFHDDVAIWIRYSGHGTFTMGNSDIARFLDENSQGHKWTLMYSNGEIRHEWVRDDGITASENLEPNVTVDPRTFFTILIPAKPAPAKTEPAIMQILGKALLIAVGMGVVIYAVCKCLAFGIDLLVKLLPRNRK